MKQLSYICLLLGTAAGLYAQNPTLSFGEITEVTPATTPPTYTVDVILTSATTSYAGQIAGLQFDLNYNPSLLNVTINAGTSATAASAVANTVCLGTSSNFGVCPSGQYASYNPFCVNSGSCVQQQNNGPGQRAIIIGCCTSSQTTPTSAIISDGVVATLTVQPAATLSSSGATLQLMGNYLAATSAGGSSVAATAIPLVVGAGTSDPGATGILNMYATYLVGDIVPETGNSAGSFGSGSVNVNDVIQILFAVDDFPGYTMPAVCTDRFDAWDSAPQDTATVRGGNGKIDVNDVIVTLFTVDDFPGYLNRVVRSSYPSGTGPSCPAGSTATANVRTEPLASQGTIIVGAAESAGTGTDRVPVYIQAGRELNRLGFTFALGDGQSQLQFQQAPEMAPTIAVDSVRGGVVLAWLTGASVRAGQQALLGYVSGPSGFAPNLRVFGLSAAGLDDHNLVGLDVSGAPLQQR